MSSLNVLLGLWQTKHFQHQLRCVEELGSTCYSSSEATRVMINLLDIEFEQAFDDTDNLGQNYISSCPLLSNNEGAVVEQKWGSRRCSYFTAEAGLRQIRSCFDSASASLDRATAAIPQSGRQMTQKET